MKDEQQFLLDNNCADLCLNNHKINNWTQRIYVSDIMEKYKRHILIHRTARRLKMEITEEQIQLVITVLDQANQDLHAEFCYIGHCSCQQREEVVTMLQNIQRTTADMRLANALPN